MQNSKTKVWKSFFTVFIDNHCIGKYFYLSVHVVEAKYIILHILIKSLIIITDLRDRK